MTDSLSYLDNLLNHLLYMRKLQKGPYWTVDLCQCEDCNAERKPYTAIYIFNQRQKPSFTEYFHLTNNKT